MTIEIKFIATDKTDLASQMRAYLGEGQIILDRPKITCSEPICYQEAVDGAIDPKEINRDHNTMTPKAELRSKIESYLVAGMKASEIRTALDQEWDIDLSLAAIGGMMGGIKRQKEKQDAHNQAVDEKILSMKTCDPLLIADSINRELGGSWTEEKVSRRLKELIA